MRLITARLLLGALAVALASCAAPPRELSPELARAERQHAAISAMHPHQTREQPAADQLAYEYGVVLPVAWLGSCLGSAPIYAGSELAQLIALPIYWDERRGNQQDHMQQASVERARACAGFWKVHGALPRAGGTASYATDPVLD